MPQELHQLILDCPPGKIRPNDVLKIIIDGLDLIEEDFKVISKSFGAWTFEISPEKNLYYASQLSKIINRVKNAYSSGLIRYAEW